MYNILVSWEELKAYLGITEREAGSSARYKARLISEMLKDDINKLYFHFVSPIVTEFERVNAFFQATDIDPHDMITEVANFHASLKGRIFLPCGSYIPLAKVDFGAKYIFERDAMIIHRNNDPTVIQQAKEIDSRCHPMLLEAESQVSKRLPTSENIFLSLSYLHPSRVLSQVDCVSLGKLPMHHLIHGTQMANIDEQYHKIKFVDWKSKAAFNDGISENPVVFWKMVCFYNNIPGETPFNELATYALSCLTTPTSNAVVERLLSYVTAVKTKASNKMSSSMLEAIVRIRTKLHFEGKCCRDFCVTPKMLELFSVTVMYPPSAAKESVDNIDEDLTLTTI